MANIQFHLLQSNDTIIFHLVANWYLSEWNIPVDKTIERLEKLTTDPDQFQTFFAFPSFKLTHI
jgi:hypothetical protein